jgi:undecaprenyl-diphosphatase
VGRTSGQRRKSGYVERRTAFDRRRADVVAAAAGLATFGACASVARSGTVGPAETAVFHALNGLPGVLSPAMQAAQYLGVLAVGPVVAVTAAVARRWRLCLAGVLVTGGKLVAERVVWQLVGRSRPGVTIPGAIVRGDAPVTGAAFVSGHVVLVTGLASVVTPYLRGRLRVVPWATVALVAFARMFLGAHAPLDVLGGFGLGLALGGAVNLVVAVPASDGAVR